MGIDFLTWFLKCSFIFTDWLWTSDLHDEL